MAIAVLLLTNDQLTDCHMRLLLPEAANHGPEIYMHYT